MKATPLSLLVITLLHISWKDHNLVAQDQHDQSSYSEIEIDFSSSADMEKFEYTDPKAWRWSQNEKGSLELFGKSDYTPEVRSPLNIAVFKEEMFGDFTMDIRARQTGIEYGHRDLCFFFHMKDASNFYYVHLASQADPHAHNIFIVNDEARKAIASYTTEGIQWGEEWHDIRITRNTSSGEILVYFDDMSSPIMKANDLHFKAGYVGFGSFDDTGEFDNFIIKGYTSTKPDAIFPKSQE
jgi:hypothetical protein